VYDDNNLKVNKTSPTSTYKAYDEIQQPSSKHNRYLYKLPILHMTLIYCMNPVWLYIPPVLLFLNRS